MKLGVEPDRTTGHKLQFLHISDSRRLNNSTEIRGVRYCLFFETYIQNILSFFFEILEYFPYNHIMGIWYLGVSQLHQKFSVVEPDF